MKSMHLFDMLYGGGVLTDLHAIRRLALVNSGAVDPDPGPGIHFTLDPPPAPDRAHGWTNPGARTDDPQDASAPWHHYASNQPDKGSTCGTWGYDPDTDEPLQALPPPGATRCRRCMRVLQGKAQPLAQAEALAWDEYEMGAPR